MVEIPPVFSLYLSIASCTILSFVLSRADVASSKRIIFGFFKKALAMAILCFWPPESYPPEEPTCVFNPVFPSFVLMNFHALAAIRASIISSSVASGFASLIFSSIDVLNNTGS